MVDVLKNGLFLAAGLLLSTGPVFAADYHVATNGSDTADGTLASPWRTLQHAANSVGAGDTVQVGGGLYTQRLVFVSSGAAGAPIVFTNAPGVRPVIDASDLTVQPGLDALVQVGGREHITVAGFELRNFKTAQEDRVPAGIYVHAGSKHIHLLDLKIHAIENTYDPGGDEVLGSDAHGLAVLGDAAANAVSNIVIDGVEIFDCKLGSSEALVLNGNVDGFTVRNCVVHDNNNIGIVCIGHEETSSSPATDQARNGRVQNNLVYNISTTGNPAYRIGGSYDRSADGIYVDGGRDIVIDRNIVHHCDVGIEVGCEHDNKAVSDVLVRNNFVYACYLTGMACGGYDGSVGRAENCRFVGNTLYHNDTGQTYSGEILVQFYVSDSRFENNLIQALSNSGDAVFVGGAGDLPTNTLFNHNLYYSDLSSNPVWTWGPTEHSTFSGWRSAGQDTNGLYDLDPRLVNPSAGDLHIETNSPAHDSGNNLVETGELDIDRLPRRPDAIVDMGADEIPPTFTTNGTPTAWLESYGLVSNSYAAADAGDTDGDGFVAWQEYRAGTHPADAASLFKIIAAEPGGRITWLGGTNLANTPFVVWRTTNLPAHSWTIAANYPRTLGVGGTNTWTDPTFADIGRTFDYRVEAPN